MKNRKAFVLVIGMAVCMFVPAYSTQAETESKIYVVNESIQQDGIKMRVLFAQNEGGGLTQTANTTFQTITVDNADQYLLRVRISLKRMDGKPIGKGFLVKAYLKDEDDNLHQYWMAGPPGRYIDVTKEEGRIIDTPVEDAESEIDYLYTVPKGIEIRAFQWDAMPSVNIHVD